MGNAPHQQLPAPETSPTNWAGYLRHHDVRIEDARIMSLGGLDINIMDHFTYFELYEDIFQSNISGVLSGIDSSNLPTSLPLTGQELLIVTFCTPGAENITQGFVIDKITERLPLKNQRAQMYDLHFVFPSFTNNLLRRVNKSYTGKISDTVKDIFKTNINTDESETAIKINVEPTVGDHRVVVPGWRPIPTINWLAKRAMSETFAPKCNYVFYQDLDGFHFVSLTSLIAKPAVQQYEHYPINSSYAREDDGGELDIDKSLRNIETLIIRGFDVSSEILKGTYASSLLVHDITTKSYNTYAYMYNSTFDSKLSLNGHPILPSFLDIYSPHMESKEYMYPRHAGLHGGIVELETDDGIKTEVIEHPDNDKAEWWVQHHDSAMNQLLFSSIEIVVAGDSNRRVGDKVIVNIPDSSKIESGENVADIMLSGNYLVTKIKHTITPGSGHTLQMRLCKDSYIAPLPNTHVYEPDNFSGDTEA